MCVHCQINFIVSKPISGNYLMNKSTKFGSGEEISTQRQQLRMCDKTVFFFTIYYVCLLDIFGLGILLNEYLTYHLTRLKVVWTKEHNKANPHRKVVLPPEP